MSKSLGNFFTVLDLLFGEGVPGEVIRYVFLSTHYRKPMDWTATKAAAAEKTLRKWHYICLTARPSKAIPIEFISALSDDLNTAQAIAILHRYANQGNAADLLACANLVGLLETKLSHWFDPDDHAKMGEDPRIYEVTKVRIFARAQGRYDISDKLRSMLVEAGVAVFDHKLTSGAFREPEALLRFVLNKAQKAWVASKADEATACINLLNSAGFSIHLDDDGPSAVLGFDEVSHEEHFESRIKAVLVAAENALIELEKSE